MKYVKMFLKRIVKMTTICFLAVAAIYFIIYLIFYIGFNYLGWD